MRYNLHPLRNLPVGTDPSVLTSDGMSVTGSAVVSLAERVNVLPDPSFEGESLSGIVTTSGSATADFYTDDASHGDQCLRVQPEGGAVSRVSSLGHATSEGRTWSLSADLRRLAGSTGRLVIRFQNSSNATTQDFPLSLSSLEASGDFTRLSVSGIAPATTSKVGWFIDGGAGNDFLVDAVQLEQSIQARPFHVGSEVVNAWNPLANGGAGGFDETLQAVRVYIPAGANVSSGHRAQFDVDPTKPFAFLTHVYTDDPGMAGNPARVNFDFHGPGPTYSFISNSPHVFTVGEAASPVALTPSLPEGTGMVRVSLRAAQGAPETNLLYSASQVAPHSIDKYRDEHTRGWRLRNEANRAQGAESIPAPNPRRTRLHLTAPQTRVHIAAPQTRAFLGGPNDTETEEATA